MSKTRYEGVAASDMNHLKTYIFQYLLSYFFGLFISLNFKLLKFFEVRGIRLRNILIRFELEVTIGLKEFCRVLYF